MQESNLLIQLLGEKVDLIASVAFVFLPVRQEVHLGKNLVGEGAGHHKGWTPVVVSSLTPWH